MAKHNHTNVQILINWDIDLCVNAKTYWQQLSEVFKPKESPWVNPFGAYTAEIIRITELCPNGSFNMGKIKRLILNFRNIESPT